jgi:hypothetical protein
MLAAVVKWQSVKKGFPEGDLNRRVLTFSPAYPKGDHMRYRILAAQFVEICKEVTHWIDVDDLEPVLTKEKP